MKRVHIIGRKNSGKTTLVVDLVRHLTSHGYRVGTIKHTHHQHELDTPGKDSFHHREAGSAIVGIVSPKMDAVFWPKHSSERPDLYEGLAPIYADCDMVLVEGHSQADVPRLEVWREANGTGPMATDDPTIVAVVSDDEVEVPVPVWGRSDIATLAQRLLELVDGGE